MSAQAQTKSEVVVFQPSRLPYHDAINERFQIDRASWKALTEAVFPNAKTADSVIMALSYCRARKLDPFKRPVHIVPMWSSATRTMIETVWPGIAELRTTAFRTGQYSGKSETEFGPTIEQTFKGEHKGETRTATVKFPEWGRVTIRRMLNGKECVFAGPKVYWLEAYAKWGSTEVPNDMWAKRPSGQLEKCVEAAGLRCAFPEEIGNDYAAEEMEGQRLHEETTHAIRDDGPPPPPSAKQHTPQPDAVEIVESGRDDGSQVVWDETSESPAPADDLDVRKQPFARANPTPTPNWRAIAEKALSDCTDAESLFAVHKNIIMPEKGKAFPPDWQAVALLYKQTFDRVSNVT